MQFFDSRFKTLGRAQPQKYVCQKQQYHRAAAVEQHVGRDPGPIGQEGLMKLVGARDDCCTKQGQRRIQQKSRPGQAHPQSAQP
jgi:hypothetical protein